MAWWQKMQKHAFQINHFSTTRYFLNTVEWTSFLTDKSKEKLGKQFYKNMTNFDFLISLMWQSVSPCHQKYQFMHWTVGNLKKCTWKGIDIPCESIFSKISTDSGICCSFNKERADEIYVESTFTKIFTELQEADKFRSLTLGKVPDWYTNQGEPKVKTGKNMGLYIEIDLHTDDLGYFSINSDFVSQTILIGQSGNNYRGNIIWALK